MGLSARCLRMLRPRWKSGLVTICVRRACVPTRNDLCGDEWNQWEHRKGSFNNLWICYPGSHDTTLHDTANAKKEKSNSWQAHQRRDTTTGGFHLLQGHFIPDEALHENDRHMAFGLVSQSLSVLCHRDS